MHTWIAERYTDSPEVWRDEDVAMTQQFQTFHGVDQDEAKGKARKMLIGMLMAESFGYEDLLEHIKSDEYRLAAQQVFNGAELVRIGQHVVFRIRRKDAKLNIVA